MAEETEKRVWARPEELDAKLARQAHAGTSFVPEKRGASEQAEFAHIVNSFGDWLMSLAETDVQKAIAEEQIAQYKANYLRRTREMLHGRAGIMSTMITGPANFPVRRMEKKNNADRRRVEEMLDWDKRAKAAAARAVLAARTTEQVEASEWAALRRDIDRNLDIVTQIDTGKGQFCMFNRSAFTTSVSGKLERFAANGEKNIVSQALAYIKEKTAEWKKPFFAARNGVWALAAEAEVIAATPAPTGEVEIASGAGWRIVNNLDAERVQILFPGKPAEALRTALKSEGWRWSPTSGAWQRQNTNAAIYSAQRIMGAAK